jgi:PII-like signaling protein
METFKGKMLRIYLEENDKIKKKALYEWILEEAMKLNIAGATVIRGIEGFGEKKHIHSVHILSISLNLPVIIEIIDKEEKISELTSTIKEAIKDCLVTLQDIDIHI